jgi:hypothetical protein
LQNDLNSQEPLRPIRPADPTAGNGLRRGHAAWTSFDAAFVYRDFLVDEVISVDVGDSARVVES